MDVQGEAAVWHIPLLGVLHPGMRLTDTAGLGFLGLWGFYPEPIAELVHEAERTQDPLKVASPFAETLARALWSLNPPSRGGGGRSKTNTLWSSC